MKLTSLLLTIGVATTSAFAPHPLTMHKTRTMVALQAEKEPTGRDWRSSVAKVATTAGLWAAMADISSAAGPDWGIFEGRTLSLLHPLTMGSLLLFSLYTALLGFQWRRQRTMGDEISALKKSLPDLGSSKTVSEALAAAKAEESPDAAKIAKLTAALPVEQQIKDLTTERKDLAAANPRDQHYSQGALLAFLGTAFAIEVSWQSSASVRVVLAYSLTLGATGSFEYLRTRR